MYQTKKNRSIPGPGKILSSLIDFGRKCSGFSRPPSVFSSTGNNAKFEPKNETSVESEVNRWNENDFEVDWNLVESLEPSRLPELSYMIAEEPEMSSTEFRTAVKHAESGWLREKEPILGFTAMHIAITYRARSLMRILMDCSEGDFLVNAAANEGVTPLHLCCQLGYKEMIEMLVNHPAIMVNQRDAFGSSALENCLMAWKLDLARLILEGPQKIKPRRRTLLFSDLNNHKKNEVSGEEAAEIANLLVAKGVRMKPLIEDLLTRVSVEAPKSNSNEIEIISKQVLNQLNPIVIAMIRGNVELLKCFLSHLEQYLTPLMLSELWKFNTKLLHEGMKYMGHFDPSNELFQRGNEITKILSEIINKYENEHPGTTAIKAKVNALTSNSKQKGYRCSRCHHVGAGDRELFDLMVDNNKLNRFESESEYSQL